MTNYKTTILGVLGLVATISGAAKTLLAGGNLDLSVVIPAIVTSWGLIHAKDSK